MIKKYVICLAGAVSVALAVSVLVSCSKQTNAPTTGSHEHHDGDTADDHASADHHDGDHERSDDGPTEENVKTPESFAAGVMRLTELHQKIALLIDENKLDEVHHAAEEMSILARKMKPLAVRDLPEDKRTDAGRFCNDISGNFKPIDEAADAGKKAETVAIHKQMADTISKLDALSKK